MTDRAIRHVADLDSLDFSKQRGLLPVLVQDASAGDALMLAYADRSALEATLATGLLHLWSRSRGQLWRKGATSGNTLGLESLHADCDGDAVLARVVPGGPACHTGDRSCFGSETAVGLEGLANLDRTLAVRATERPEHSYTVCLLDDPNLRLKKLGEEVAELVAALAIGDSRRATEEAADLVYHMLVALRADGIRLRDVVEELSRRAR